MMKQWLRFWRVEELRVLGGHCCCWTVWTCQNPKKWLSYLAWRAKVHVVVEALKPAPLLLSSKLFPLLAGGSRPAGNGNVPLLQRGCAESRGTGDHDSQPPWELSPVVLL